MSFAGIYSRLVTENGRIVLGKGKSNAEVTCAVQKPMEQALVE